MHVPSRLRPARFAPAARRHRTARASVGRTLLALVLPLAVGCGDAGPPTAPIIPPDRPAGPTPAPVFPPLARAAEVYVADLSLYAASAEFHGGALASRLVFYEGSGDGAARFGLQFASPRWGFFEYLGWYTRNGGELALAFDNEGFPGTWYATATVQRDSMQVRYSPYMSLSDFVDGVYVRAPRTP